MFHEKIEKPIKYYPNTEELKKGLKELYIIDDYMTSYDEYEKFIDSINNVIKGCIEHKECREYPIKFKFYRNDKTVHELQLRHFYVNIILWYPFIYLHEIDNILNEEYIMDCTKIYDVTKYINKKIILKLRDYAIKNTLFNKSISQVTYYLRRISVDYSDIMNLNISTEDFLEIYSHPRMKQIMETKFPENMQPAEIEEELHKLNMEEIDIIKSMKDNSIGIILRTGKGIKHKQLAEMTINLGLKPSLEGETIPLPINSNTFIGGLHKPSYLYIDALGARKSLISNKMIMGKAGYFGKIILLLARSLSLSKNVSDCGTNHLIEIHLHDKKMVSKYDFRYYKFHPSDPDYKLLRYNDDVDKLVGKTLYFRSPTKCACGGNEICHKCFGRTSLLNLDIADGVSGFEVEETSKEVNQMILSTKHLLSTLSKLIKFNLEFYKFFELNLGEITPILENSEFNLDDYQIYIPNNEIFRTDELDDESRFNAYILNGFKIIKSSNKKNKEDEIIEISSIGDLELFLTDEALSLLRKGNGYIKFKDLENDTVLFNINFQNNELTKPLYDLMDLLNKSKEGDIEMTIDKMCERFTQLLVESGIKATALSGEVIINRLLRAVDSNYDFPNFSGLLEPEYKIFTILKSLEYNRSPLLGLASQDLKRQILSDDLFTEKYGTSYLDPFFREKLSNELLLEYNKIIKDKDIII